MEGPRGDGRDPLDPAVELRQLDFLLTGASETEARRGIVPGGRGLGDRPRGRRASLPAALLPRLPLYLRKSTLKVEEPGAVGCAHLLVRHAVGDRPD